MKACEKLVQLLEAEGLHGAQVFPVQGFWKRVDVYRWEGYARTVEGIQVSLYSWSTVTRCIREGIMVRDDPDGPGAIEVLAGRAQ